MAGNHPPQSISIPCGTTGAVPGMDDAMAGLIGPVQRRRAPWRWALAGLVAATLIALTLFAGYSPGSDSAPDVEVVGGVATEVTHDLVRVIATSPSCRVLLTTAEGRDRPGELRLELLNVGAASKVTGLVKGEMLERHSRSATAVIGTGAGWPRWVNSSLPAPADGNWSFIAIGDPQGHDWNVGAAGALAKATGARFILLLGDTTASGETRQFDRLADALDAVDVPVYATPGNHDVKGGSTAGFTRIFGATEGAFDHGGVRFVLLDTSCQVFDAASAARLRSMTGGRAGGERLIVATHTSPIDPRPGLNNTFLSASDSSELMDAVDGVGADLLLAGHVHMYCSTATAGGVPIVITGGGGGVMELLDDPGSFHHLLKVDVSPSGISWAPIPLSDLPPGGDGAVQVEVEGRDGRTVLLTLPQLRAMATLEGRWSFEDRLGNIEGTGLYRAVPVRALIALVGAMDANDTLAVTARDAYTLTLAYGNVFPDGTARQAQGELALAVSFEGNAPPAWDAGPRLLFTPADGLFSNADAEAATDPALFPGERSAGSMWVREVARLEVVPW